MESTEKKVLVTFKVFPEDKEVIEKTLKGLAEVSYASNEEAILREISDAEVVICGWISDKALLKAEKLRLIQTVTAGVERFNFKILREKNVILASGKGCNSVPVAEHAMALILNLAKRINEYDRALKRGKWLPYTSETMLDDLEGKVLVILGYGNIGRELARIAKVFGMRIIGIKRTPKLNGDEYADVIVGFDNIDKVIPEADFLVVLAPLTKETLGLINERRLKMMKRTAYLINVARGPVIDEAALYRALKEGWIRGAGLDVWWAYPPDPATPSKLGIHKLKNVIATPHKAGWTMKARLSCVRFAVSNVRRFLLGEKPLNIVDYDRGY